MSGEQVWAERFDRDATDLFTVQDEITELVVGALEPELGFVERRRVRLAPPESLDAWGHYQRDLDHMYRRTEEHDALAAQDIRRQLLWPTKVIVVRYVATRRREWLLDITFRKRETFAYACEAYAWILERAKPLSARSLLAGELEDDFGTGDERVGHGEVAEVVRQAAARRTGWKVILGMCAATPGSRRVAASQPDPATAS